MVETFSNTLALQLDKPFQVVKEQQRHLYVLEILSQVCLSTPRGVFHLRPYDIVVGQSFQQFQLHSLDQTPLLIRCFGIVFEIPSPLNQYTVGDNPLIHDLMNEGFKTDAYVVFTHLEVGVCHAYLEVLERLESLKKIDEVYVQFQEQKVAGLLFTELLREHTSKVSKSASRFPTTQVKYASKDSQSGAIMEYISKNIHEITMAEAAAHFSYQPNYFSRLCHQLFGVSFNELRTHIRLEIAKEQLRLTTKSVEEISQELGYKAVSNFHRNFKSREGLTPNEYRKQKQFGWH